MLFRGIIILLVAVLGAGYLNMSLTQSAGTATENQDAYADAGTVAAHHLDSFMARDIDAVMGDYAPDSVLVLPDGVYSGTESIREQILKAFENGDQDAAPFNVTGTQAAGSLAYATWTWDMADGSIVEGSDTFIVHNGKIAKHTVAFFLKEAPAADDAADMMDAPASES
jgi:ketosteroid isomerase-like protein